MTHRTHRIVRWTYGLALSAFGGLLLYRQLSPTIGALIFGAGLYCCEPAMIRRYAKLAAETWRNRNDPPSGPTATAPTI